MAPRGPARVDGGYRMSRLWGTRARAPWLLACLLLPVLQPAQAEEGVSSRAEGLAALVAQGRAAEAFDVGLRQLSEHGGDPRFDFAFGMAALEAGHYDHASMAFRRVLVLEPGSDRVRLELARALYLAGDDQGARSQFERVLGNQPPANVQDRILQFLDAIDARERAAKTRFVPRVALRLGYDDNPGNATDSEFYLVPIPVPLSAEVEADGFSELALAADYRRPIDKRWSLFAAGGYTRRAYQQENDYDLGILDLQGGARWAAQSGTFRFPLQFQRLDLGGEHFRNLLAASAEWSRALGRRTELSLFGQLGRVDYPQAEPRDVLTQLLGGTVGHRLDNGLQLQAGAFAGREQADGDYDYNGRDFLGLRAGLGWPLTPTQSLSASAVLQQSSYHDRDPLFFRRREEGVTQLQLGWAWRPVSRWLVQAGASYYDSRSTVDMFDYDRLQITLGAQYAWE